MNPHDDEGAEIELVTKRHGTWIPDWVILAKKLSDREFRVYSILRMHCGKDRRVFPGQKTIAEMLGGAKLDSVGKAIAKLRDFGLLRIEVERHQAGRRNVYYLYEDPPEGYKDGPVSRAEFYAQRGVTPQTGVTPQRGDIPPKRGGGHPPDGGDGSPPKRGSEVKQVEVSKRRTSKHTVAAAPAASTDGADDLFTSWPGSQGLDGEDQNQTPEDQNQTTTGSDDLNDRARDERADARATNAGHVTAAWVDAYTAVRGDVAPTKRQVGQASRCAKELLDAGNDADRVMEAARLAGAAGYPTIDRQLAMMTAPRTYGRNGHVPYENPTDASVYLEPIQ